METGGGHIQLPESNKQEVGAGSFLVSPGDSPDPHPTPSQAFATSPRRLLGLETLAPWLVLQCWANRLCFSLCCAGRRRSPDGVGCLFPASSCFWAWWWKGGTPVVCGLWGSYSAFPCTVRTQRPASSERMIRAKSLCSGAAEGQ